MKIMRKLLIIYAHPDTDGYNKEILKNTLDVFKNKKIDYKLLDLYKINYNPILDKEEIPLKGGLPLKETIKIQKDIKERDLIFIYPIWWGTMPAILKGFMDRVFSAGFAYKYVNGIPRGLLKGKKALVLSTSGAPNIYNWITCKRATKGLTKNILSFCAVKSKAYIFGNALNIDKDRENVKKFTIKKINSFLKIK
jgi:NAD(P)H dehydrogenase (quinone)